MSVAVIGVGSNLGSRQALIRCAARLLDARASVSVVAQSPLYETAPLGPPQGAYLNGAFRVQTAESPESLLALLLRIERRLGRVRDPDTRWGPRTIDLDLLWFEGQTRATPTLQLPHKHLSERAFALQPLLDVAPELRPGYDDVLHQFGKPLVSWRRAANVVDGLSAPTRAVVESDSVPDALALCVATLFKLPADSPASPIRRTLRATRRCSSRPTLDGWLDGVRRALGAGFVPTDATFSHCSESQWLCDLHGDMATPPVTDGLTVTRVPGDGRTHRVALVL